MIQSRACFAVEAALTPFNPRSRVAGLFPAYSSAVPCRHGVLRGILDELQAHYPLFANARVEETWAGALVSTPDNMPVISGVEGIPGLFLGTGFYYGLTMGPAAGQALADLVSGQTPAFDVRPSRYERFIDGSMLQFQA